MADCFWTDLVGVSQDCTSVVPGGVYPQRAYLPTANNGVMTISWADYGDAGDGVEAPGLASGTRFGIYLSGGDWRVKAGVESYFPYDPDDRAEATISIYRALRANSYSVFGGDSPDNFTAWADYVGDVVVDNLSVEQSVNGNIPYSVYGLAPGLPEFDPDYIYFLDASVNIYSPADVLVATSNQTGAVYDTAGEVPDAESVTTPINLSVYVVPTVMDSFDAYLVGIGAAFVRDDSDAVVMYATGEWRGVLSDFICDEFEASFDDAPAITVPNQCS